MSLRARLLVALVATVAVALFAADVATYAALRSYLFDRVDRSLREQILPGTRDGPDRDGIDRDGPGGDRAGPLDDDDGPLDADGDGRAGGPADPIVAVERRGADGTVEDRSPARFPDGRAFSPLLPASLPVTEPSNDANGPAAFLTVGSDPPGGPRFRAKVSQLPNGDTLVVALPLDATEATLRELQVAQAIVTALALLGAVAAGWLLTNAGLRPLRRVEAVATTIAAGDLDHRVPGEGNRTELGRLAGALNAMLDQLRDRIAAEETTQAALRRFVADASHELRTPIAAVGAYAELFDLGAADRPDDLRRVMDGIRGESRRIAALVDDLLTLARLDEDRTVSPPTRVPVELVGLVGEAVAAARAIGPAWPVRLVATEPVEAVGDELQLRRVVDNLLANVRAHTPPGTTCHVTVRWVSPSEAVVEIADDGPGVDPDELPQLFERFWRADRSRSRASGGSGLGLAIVAGIVAAHDGEVTAARSPTGGLVVSLRLPATGAATA